MENQLFAKNIKLKKKHIKYLSNQPETGMGYHVVNLIMKNGDILVNIIVLNGMYLKIENDLTFDANLIERIKVCNS